MFNYLVPNDNEVSIAIYNYLGQKVAELINDATGGETYSVPMSISKLPEGIYIVLFKTNENFETSKLYIIK